MFLPLIFAVSLLYAPSAVHRFNREISPSLGQEVIPVPTLGSLDFIAKFRGDMANYDRWMLPK
jgi:hypothetical protein